MPSLSSTKWGSPFRGRQGQLVRGVLHDQPGQPRPELPQSLHPRINPRRVFPWDDVHSTR
jgi:hypothetical protein